MCGMWFLVYKFSELLCFILFYFLINLTSVFKLYPTKPLWNLWVLWKFAPDQQSYALILGHMKWHPGLVTSVTTLAITRVIPWPYAWLLQIWWIFGVLTPPWESTVTPPTVPLPRICSDYPLESPSFSGTALSMQIPLFTGSASSSSPSALGTLCVLWGSICSFMFFQGTLSLSSNYNHHHHTPPSPPLPRPSAFLLPSKPKASEGLRLWRNKRSIFKPVPVSVLCGGGILRHTQAYKYIMC